MTAISLPTLLALLKPLDVSWHGVSQIHHPKFNKERCVCLSRGHPWVWQQQHGTCNSLNFAFKANKPNSGKPTNNYFHFILQDIPILWNFFLFSDGAKYTFERLNGVQKKSRLFQSPTFLTLGTDTEFCFMWSKIRKTSSFFNKEMNIFEVLR